MFVQSNTQSCQARLVRKARRYFSNRRCFVIYLVASFFLLFVGLVQTTSLQLPSVMTMLRTVSLQQFFSQTPDLSLIPPFRVQRVNCAALFAGHQQEQNKTLQQMKSYNASIASDLSFATMNCTAFLQRRQYITSEMTPEEADFPIAYSIVTFKDLGQVERLLRSIYRPQNAYCFHTDSKASVAFQRGIRRLVSCFPNVVMADRAVDVRWGTWSVLEADLQCMRKLLRRFAKWKYLINLTGQEFPLRTNLELVRILKAFNGSNSMEGTVKRMNRDRIPTKKLAFNVTWTKGAVHIVAKRAFFEFALNNNKSLQIAELLKSRNVPDETFFSTLNHNPSLGTPGAYLGDPETGDDYPFMPRFKNWGSFPCHGIRVRAICIWAVLDLPLINKRPELFLNKLYWNFQPYTLDCLEERIFNHTRRDYGDESATIDEPLNIEFYRNLSQSKNHQ